MRLILLGLTCSLLLALFFSASMVGAGPIGTPSEWKAKDFDFRNTVLVARAFKNVYLNHGDLRGAQWTSVQMENFDIKSANLSGLKIKNSKFVGGRIAGSEFKSLVITDTVFEDVTLPKRFQTDAVLINVGFNNCRFVP